MNFENTLQTTVCYRIEKIQYILAKRKIQTVTSFVK